MSPGYEELREIRRGFVGHQDLGDVGYISISRLHVILSK